MTSTKFQGNVLSVNGTTIKYLKDGAEHMSQCTENVGKYAKQGEAEITEKDGVVTFVKNNQQGNQTNNQSSNFNQANNSPAPQKKDRESYREEAEKAVKDNLTSAQKVAQEVGIQNPTPQDLVALGDMVGRTITSLLMRDKNGK